jgi:hypothetical protein
MGRGIRTNAPPCAFCFLVAGTIQRTAFALSEALLSDDRRRVGGYPSPWLCGISNLRAREHQTLWFQITYRQNIPDKGLSVRNSCSRPVS